MRSVPQRSFLSPFSVELGAALAAAFASERTESVPAAVPDAAEPSDQPEAAIADDPDSVEAASLMAELDLQGRAALKNRKIVFPDGSYFTFAAILTGYEPDAPIDDKMAASVTLKVSGKPTLVQV